MSLLDQVVLRRAEEQVAAAAVDHRWERDSWDVTGPRWRHMPKQRRRPCLAGDCARRVVAMGYCHRHAQKIRAGVALDVDVNTRRRRTA